jgi:mannitol/fructose-specific phosphotransferase system IIA component (Ntr-type)
MNKSAPPVDPVGNAVVEVNLVSADAPNAICELHRAVSTDPDVHHPDRLLESLLARHRLGASCLNPDFAITHARTSAVKRPVLAFGRSVKGIFFDQKHPSVRLVAMIGVPLAAVSDYLRYTSWIARAAAEAATCNALLAAKSPDEFRQALRGITLASPSVSGSDTESGGRVSERETS